MLSPVFENMAGMFAGFENFDELINRAISECGIHSRSIPSLGVEKEQEETKILETLPEDFCYKFNNLSANGQKLSFSTEDITAENLDRWLTEFQTINSITLKIKTKKKPTTGYLIQNYYRCQHNTRRWSPSKDPQRKLHTNPAARVKNTNCPFQLIIKINTSGICFVDIDWAHNHNRINLEASNFKDISSSTIEKVKKLYEDGNTPSIARQVFLKDLKQSCNDEMTYHVMKADRSITPRKRDFNYLYDQFTKEQFGGKNGEMFQKLEEKMEEYLKNHPDASVKYQLYGGDETPLIISIVTPLMKRVHKEIPQSGELIFVDATSNTDEHNLKVFLLCTHNVSGALPCGLAITSDEKESTVKLAFQMLIDCLPEYAFYGRGSTTGPKVILTDNCLEERKALKSVWPTVTLLLCIFHVLQQVWRWVVDKNHHIDQHDRPEVFSLFKKALYAGSEENFDDCYEDLLSDDVCSKYPNLLQYYRDLYKMKKDFALCFRYNLLVRGNQTNNFVESQFLVLKDVLLRRVKEYNVVGLFDKLTIDLENHYKDKLLSIADGSFDGNFRHRFLGKDKQKADGGQGFKVPTQLEQKTYLEKVKVYENNVFEVPSLSEEDSSYFVDMAIGVCSCVIGRDGSPCKHQYLLWVSNIAHCVNFVPVSNPQSRQKLAWIAMGQALPIAYYTNLRANSNNARSIEAENQSCEVDCPGQQDCQQINMDDPILIEAEDRLKGETIKEGTTAVKEACELLVEKLKSTGDKNLAKGVKQFSARLVKLSNGMPGNLVSALFNFGAAELRSTRTGRKIKVQPGRKRKSNNGSHQAITKGRPTTLKSIEPPRKHAKRQHSLAMAVKENVPPSKKSGSHAMRSKCT